MPTARTPLTTRCSADHGKHGSRFTPLIIKYYYLARQSSPTPSQQAKKHSLQRTKGHASKSAPALPNKPSPIRSAKTDQARVPRFDRVGEPIRARTDGGTGLLQSAGRSVGDDCSHSHVSLNNEDRIESDEVASTHSLHTGHRLVLEGLLNAYLV
jgi:hypothetical protein